MLFRSMREPKRWEKLAGILIETAVTRNEGRYCVIGVGVNMAKPASTDLSIPAAGLRELRENISAPQALASIAKPLLSTVLAFEAKGFGPLQTAFAQRDVLRDLPVTLSDGRQGIARGVDNTGVLRVETSQGLELIHSAEVRVRPST